MSTPSPERAAGTPAHSDNFADGPRLLADIGGTNARFALTSRAGQVDAIRRYPVADYPNIDAAIRQYLADTGIATPRHAAIAIANPIDGDQVHMTNRDWRFSIRAVRETLGFDTFEVINDFAALALAVPHLRAGDWRDIGGGADRPDAPLAVVGPGTGLGVAGVMPLAGGWLPVPSEGGHSTFAPSDERERIIEVFARRRWDHVSYERLLSGPGIRLIHAALSERDGSAALDDTGAIVELAQRGETRAVETLQVFSSVLGAFAGNIALIFAALGGVFIGGGVVPRLGAAFDETRFRAAFEAKGRFQPYLSRVRTRLIVNEFPAFVGVAALLTEQLDGQAARA